MPAPVTNEKVPVSGTVIQAIAAQSNSAANAICSVILTGISSATIIGLTQMIITSTGATAATCASVTISGISTNMIAGGALTMMFGVPAGAGVPAVPLVAPFDPPLLAAPGGTIRAQMGALGTGHVQANINLVGKVLPATASS